MNGCPYASVIFLFVSSDDQSEGDSGGYGLCSHGPLNDAHCARRFPKTVWTFHKTRRPLRDVLGAVLFSCPSLFQVDDDVAQQYRVSSNMHHIDQGIQFDDQRNRRTWTKELLYERRVHAYNTIIMGAKGLAVPKPQQARHRSMLLR